MSAKSRLILTSVHLVGAGWLCSLLWFWLFSASGDTWGYVVIHFAMAVVFWRMSRGRVFPVPLFLTNALQVVNYGVMTFLGVATWWQLVFANRIFEISVLYIIACAIFRRAVLAKSSVHKR